MNGPKLSPQALDAVRRLAYLDGDRTSVLKQIVTARQRAERDQLAESRRAAVSAASEAVKATRSARLQQEGALQELQARLKRTDDRLASGYFTTAREVQAAEIEIGQLRAAISTHEEELLTILVREEGEQRTLADAQAQLDAEEPRAAERRRMAAQDAAAAEARVKEIDADRRAAAHLLPADVRDRYRALYQRTGGRPFAFALSGICDHCHHPLPGSAVQLLRSHQGVPACPSCGRLLIEQG